MQDDDNNNNGNSNGDEMYVESVPNPRRRNLLINLAVGGILTTSAVTSWSFLKVNAYPPPSGFQRLPSTQFVAALGDPTARHGTGAQDWGLWRLDPGPRGVWLRHYQRDLGANHAAPAGWKFDPNDWWVEEHGLIMEAPQFPMPPGRYLVTGGRQVTTGLTIHADGRWELDEGTLYDVTHLPCRSARYKPNGDGTSDGSPANARLTDFPVRPGGVMPSVPGTNKQDYAVLFLVGKAT